MDSENKKNDGKKIPGLSLRERLALKNPDKHGNAGIPENVRNEPEQILEDNFVVNERDDERSPTSIQNDDMTVALLKKLEDEKRELELRLAREEEQRRSAEEMARRSQEAANAAILMQRDRERQAEERAMSLANENAKKALEAESRKIEEERERIKKEAKEMEIKIRADAEKLARDGAKYLMSQERAQLNQEVQVQTAAKEALEEKLKQEMATRLRMEEEARVAREEIERLKSNVVDAKKNHQNAIAAREKVEASLEKEGSSVEAKSLLDKAMLLEQKTLAALNEAEEAANIPKTQGNKDEMTNENSNKGNVLQPKLQSERNIGLKQPKGAKQVETKSEEVQSQGKTLDDLLMEAIKNKDADWIISNADATGVQPIRQEIIVSKNEGDLEIFKALLYAGYKIDLRAGLTLKNAIAKKYWAIVDHIERLSPEPGDTAKTIGRYIVDLRAWQRSHGLTSAPGSLSENAHLHAPKTVDDEAGGSSSNIGADELEGFLSQSLSHLEDDARKALSASHKDEGDPAEKNAGAAAALAVADILGQSLPSERKKLHGEISTLKTEIDQREEQIVELSMSEAEKTLEITRLTEEVEKLKSLLDEHNQELSEALSKSEAATIETYEGKLGEMRSALQSSEQALAETREQLQEVNAEMTKLRSDFSEFSDLEDTVTLLRNENSTIKAELEGAEKEADNVRSELEALKQNLKELSEEKGLLEARIGDLEEEKDKLAADCEIYSERDGRTQNEVMELRKNIGLLEQEREMLNVRLGDLETEVNTATQSESEKVGVLSARIDELVKSLEDAEERIAEAQETSTQSNESEMEVLQAKVENISELLSQSELRVKELEEAVEASLEENRIIADAQKPLLALNWLAGTDEEQTRRNHPLVDAVLSGEIDMIEKVISNMEVSHEDLGYALAFAVQTNSQEIISFLISLGANPSFGNDLPLVMACEGGFAKSAIELVRAGADQSREAAFALRAFAKLDDVDTCRVLISYGANPNAGDSLPLKDAIENGANKTAMLLMYMGARLRDDQGNLHPYIESDQSLIDMAEWIEGQRSLLTQLHPEFVKESLNLPIFRAVSK